MKLAGLMFSACACAAVSLCLCLLLAVTLKLAGRGPQARDLLGFEFDTGQRSPSAALGIAATNARLVAGILLCAAVAPHLSVLGRGLVTCALAFTLVLNATAIGTALGAYGTRLVVAVAPHGLLELAALSLAGGAYLQAPLSPWQLAAIGLAAVALLLVAAMLETYVSGGGPR